ncbi:MarR family winged helix-turn-helix transcriptional regulator [Glutamicibacter halophytocola]|uniref:MarR family winged helix-turn-helix transcriptional regulator n=1 Tax=Glutamicibacter halophytocola TaxID=1933880 RepID=UPI001892A73E|nr:MarR family transcriptional regulator [Glutamicibacter halophytocola]
MASAPPFRSSDLFRALLRLQRAHALYEVRWRARLNLNDTDLRTLNLIRCLSAPSPGELAKELGVSSAGITAVLDRLEARHVIQRQQHATDRRRTVVHPGSGFPETTGEGIAVLRSLHRFCDQLDEPSRLALRALLGEILLTLQAAGTGPADHSTPPDSRSSEQ